jgi:hypothetical protein
MAGMNNPYHHFQSMNAYEWVLFSVILAALMLALFLWSRRKK